MVARFFHLRDLLPGLCFWIIAYNIITYRLILHTRGASCCQNNIPLRCCTGVGPFRLNIDINLYIVTNTPSICICCNN